MKKEPSQTYSAIRSREWREKNQDHIKEYAIQYRAENHDKLIEGARQWKKDNPDKVMAQRAAYQEKNGEAFAEYSRIYYSENTEACNARCRSWYNENKEYNKDRVKQWVSENPEKKAFAKNKNQNKRYAEEPAYRIERNLRARLAKVTREAKVGKVDSTMALLGCSIGRFMDYLKAHFQPGMTFDNCVIDHRKPCAAFDLSDPEQQRQCFNFQNLQPLFAKDNTEKGDTYPWPRQAEIDKSTYFPLTDTRVAIGVTTQLA